MGILKDKLLRKKNTDKGDDFNAIYKEIFSIIADHDENVTAEINDCVDNPRLFAQNNEELYDARGINAQTAAEFKIKWIGCAELMIKHGCAKEFDHNVSFDDFYDEFAKLKVVESRDILPDDDKVYLDYDIISWFRAIDRCWQKSGMCVGGIDIDSDSYVLFVCTVEQLDKLSKLSDTVGRKIRRAAEL